MAGQKKVFKGIVVFNIIITMTLYYFLLIGVTAVTYATSATDGDVEFESYFKDEEGNKVTSLDVAITEEAYLYFSINVLNEGYFNGEISINNSNFDINDEIIDDNIGSIEDNTIKLSQVNNGEKLEIKVKINIKTANEYDLNLLDLETETTLTGTYVNSKSEKYVEETANVKLTLKSPYSTSEETLNLEVITNKAYEIDGETKRLVQVLITSSLDGNSYPVEQTNISLSAPENVEEVLVYTRGTYLTNGNDAEEELDEECYIYNEEEGTVEIILQNKIEENENGESVVSWENSGNDKLIVTYILPENTELPIQIDAYSKIYLYDGYITDHETSVISDYKSIIAEDEITKIITGEIEPTETSIYKGKIYSGEEREISIVTKVEINYAGVEDEITIGKANAYYDELDANLTLNTTTIEKSILEKILGENGYLTVIAENTEIAKIDEEILSQLEELNESEEEDKSIYQSEYASISLAEENIQIKYSTNNDINFVIHNAETQGVVYIKNEYSLINTEYTRAELVNVSNLNLTSNIQTSEKNEEIATNIVLENTTTKANFKINNGTLNENKVTEGVEFLVLLRCDSEKYDLYNNPYIEIELPEEITEISINSVKLVYGDGLTILDKEIYENEEGKKVIKVTMEGTQATHQINESIKGTYVVINADLKLGEIDESKEADVTLKVTNNDEYITYENDGEIIKTIKYIQDTTVQTQAVVTAMVEEEEEKEDITVVKTASVENGAIVKEREIIKYTISVTNNTNGDIDNITLTDEIPEEVTYVYYYTGGGFSNGYQEDSSIKTYEKTDISIEAGETETFSYCVIVNKDSENIGSELISGEAVVTIEGYADSFKSNTYVNIIEEGKIEINIAYTKNVMEYLSAGDYFTYIVKVKNLTDGELTDIVIKDELVEQLDYVDGYILGKAEDGTYNLYAEETTQEGITYDEKTRTVEFDVGNLAEGEEKAVYIKVTINESENTSTKYIENTVYVDVGEERYTAFPETIRQEEENYEISMETDVEGTYITEGEEFVYTVILKNTGDITTSGTLKVELPEGVTGNTCYYSISSGGSTETLDTANHVDVVDYSEAFTDLLSGETAETANYEVENEEETVYNNTTVFLLTTLYANTTLTMKIYVTADSLDDDVEELEITNSATYEDVTSNEIYNIIIKATNKDDDDGNGNTTEGGNTAGGDTTGGGNTTEGENTTEGGNTTDDGNTQSSDNENEYSSISGVVWIDENSNGTRESSEERVSNVQVRLLDNSANTYIATTITNSNGYYEFTNLSNGIYIVEFSYDDSQYKLTEYQKENVSSSLNSDVISTVDNDGIGYTDTITIDDEDVENIDMGLIYSGSFDLKLDKTVSSIVVSNSSGNKTTTYDNSSLAKVEIKSKLLSSSTVVVTYNITVTNEGEIAGYVDKIVDYMPSGMTFNSSMNSNWYQSDGVLITNSLSGQIINPGESKAIQLVLVKNMTTSNTGTVSNSAEIMEVSNSESIEDTDSTPNNQDTSEDDYSTANVIISISTGKIAKYVSMILLIILVIALTILLILKKKNYWDERRK